MSSHLIEGAPLVDGTSVIEGAPLVGGTSVIEGGTSGRWDICDRGGHLW